MEKTMELEAMKRKELQKLCRQHKIPGNTTNAEMIERLKSIFEAEKKPKRKGCLKPASKRSGEGSKKVTFVVEEDEEIEILESGKENSSRRKPLVVVPDAPARSTRSRGLAESVVWSPVIEKTKTRSRAHTVCENADEKELGARGGKRARNADVVAVSEVSPPITRRTRQSSSSVLVEEAKSSEVENNLKKEKPAKRITRSSTNLVHEPYYDNPVKQVSKPIRRLTRRSGNLSEENVEVVEPVRRTTRSSAKSSEDENSLPQKRGKGKFAGGEPALPAKRSTRSSSGILETENPLPQKQAKKQALSREPSTVPVSDSEALVLPSRRSTRSSAKISTDQSSPPVDGKMGSDTIGKKSGKEGKKEASSKTSLSESEAVADQPTRGATRSSQNQEGKSISQDKAQKQARLVRSRHGVVANPDTVSKVQDKSLPNKEVSRRSRRHAPVVDELNQEPVRGNGKTKKSNKNHMDQGHKQAARGVSVSNSKRRAESEIPEVPKVLNDTPARTTRSASRQGESINLAVCTSNEDIERGSKRKKKRTTEAESEVPKVAKVLTNTPGQNTRSASRYREPNMALSTSNEDVERGSKRKKTTEAESKVPKVSKVLNDTPRRTTRSASRHDESNFTAVGTSNENIERQSKKKRTTEAKTVQNSALGIQNVVVSSSRKSLRTATERDIVRNSPKQLSQMQDVKDGEKIASSDNHEDVDRHLELHAVTNNVEDVQSSCPGLASSVDVSVAMETNDLGSVVTGVSEVLHSPEPIQVVQFENVQDLCGDRNLNSLNQEKTDHKDEDKASELHELVKSSEDVSFLQPFSGAFSADLHSADKTYGTEVDICDVAKEIGSQVKQSPVVDQSQEDDEAILLEGTDNNEEPSTDQKLKDDEEETPSVIQNVEEQNIVCVNQVVDAEALEAIGVSELEAGDVDKGSISEAHQSEVSVQKIIISCEGSQNVTKSGSPQDLSTSDNPLEGGNVMVFNLPRDSHIEVKQCETGPDDSAKFLEDAPVISTTAQLFRADVEEAKGTKSPTSFPEEVPPSSLSESPILGSAKLQENSPVVSSEPQLLRADVEKVKETKSPVLFPEVSPSSPSESPILEPGLDGSAKLQENTPIVGSASQLLRADVEEVKGTKSPISFPEEVPPSSPNESPVFGLCVGEQVTNHGTRQSDSDSGSFVKVSNETACISDSLISGSGTSEVKGAFLLSPLSPVESDLRAQNDSEVVESSIHSVEMRASTYSVTTKSIEAVIDANVYKDGKKVVEVKDTLDGNLHSSGKHFASGFFSPVVFNDQSMVSQLTHFVDNNNTDDVTEDLITEKPAEKLIDAELSGNLEVDAAVEQIERRGSLRGEGSNDHEDVLVKEHDGESNKISEEPQPTDLSSHITPESLEFEDYTGKENAQATSGDQKLVKDDSRNEVVTQTAEVDNTSVENVEVLDHCDRFSMSPLYTEPIGSAEPASSAQTSGTPVNQGKEIAQETNGDGELVKADVRNQENARKGKVDNTSMERFEVLDHSDSFSLTPLFREAFRSAEATSGAQTTATPAGQDSTGSQNAQATSGYEKLVKEDTSIEEDTEIAKMGNTSVGKSELFEHCDSFSLSPLFSEAVSTAEPTSGAQRSQTPVRQGDCVDEKSAPTLSIGNPQEQMNADIQKGSVSGMNDQNDKDLGVNDTMELIFGRLKYSPHEDPSTGYTEPSEGKFDCWGFGDMTDGTNLTQASYELDYEDSRQAEVGVSNASKGEHNRLEQSPHFSRSEKPGSEDAGTSPMQLEKSFSMNNVNTSRGNEVKLHITDGQNSAEVNCVLEVTESERSPAPEAFTGVQNISGEVDRLEQSSLLSRSGQPSFEEKGTPVIQSEKFSLSNVGDNRENEEMLHGMGSRKTLELNCVPEEEEKNTSFSRSDAEIQFAHESFAQVQHMSGSPLVQEQKNSIEGSDAVKKD